MECNKLNSLLKVLVLKVTGEDHRTTTTHRVHLCDAPMGPLVLEVRGAVVCAKAPQSIYDGVCKATSVGHYIVQPRALPYLNSSRCGSSEK